MAMENSLESDTNSFVRNINQTAAGNPFMIYPMTQMTTTTRSRTPQNNTFR